MSGVLNKIERAIEDAVEGSSRRLFRPRLEPVSLAKAAARAMQQERVIGTDGPEVPNSFVIEMHPADFEKFAPYRVSLQRKISLYLGRVAEERGLVPVSAWCVELVPNEAITPRKLRVRTAMRDAPAASDPHGVAGTARLAAQRSSAGSGVAFLVREDGHKFAISEHVTALGRALENDVVIPDTRVSRFHAEIHQRGDQYILRDLKSTNGTAVAGRRKQEHALRGGDEVSLGGFTLVFRLESE